MLREAVEFVVVFTRYLLKLSAQLRNLLTGDLSVHPRRMSKVCSSAISRLSNKLEVGTVFPEATLEAALYCSGAFVAVYVYAELQRQFDHGVASASAASSSKAVSPTYLLNCQNLPLRVASSY